jgi:hypothetical protein
MRDQQTHPGAAVGERKHREVPFGSVFGVQRGAGLFAQPCVELFARPRRLNDFQIGLTASRDPAVAGERQRRAFDAAG